MIDATGPQPTPLTVTLVGTEDVSLSRRQETMAVTPDHLPNLRVRVITPLLAVSIRFANAYVTMLVGLLVAGATTGAIPASDFLHLALKCAGLALSGPSISLGKDLITILGRLEQKYPLLTGSV